MEDHPVPTLLYHYTDAQGLLGIVQSHAIWATHIYYLNDAQEFAYAADLAAQVVREQDRASAEPREHEILTRLSGIAHLSVRARMPQNVCVASFSEVGDALSQWRGYCPNGAGYSIGFVTEDLVGEAAGQGFSLARCLYDEESQRGAITQALEEVRHSVQWTQALEQGTRLAYYRVTGVWLNRFGPLAPTIKHQAFHEEQEWRLISAPVPFEDSRWHVRAGRSMLIPYIPITLAPSGASLPIQEVVVGPTPHMELARTAASVLLGPQLERLTRVGLKSRYLEQIRPSRVPYRNW
jgi:hypothetical protein